MEISDKPTPRTSTVVYLRKCNLPIIAHYFSNNPADEVSAPFIKLCNRPYLYFAKALQQNPE